MYKTYPFSDPNPIAVRGKIYSYFRYDGFTDRAEDKAWNVVVLENDYVAVTIMPEIGGKVWGATDKTTGLAYIYDNDVVKFRDISLRGPWTSGGIEFNYGVVGHSPTTSYPVDYLTRENADGSASCIIRMLDLLTRTTWSVDIRLRPMESGLRRIPCGIIARAFRSLITVGPIRAFRRRKIWNSFIPERWSCGTTALFTIGPMTGSTARIFRNGARIIFCGLNRITSLVRATNISEHGGPTGISG